MIACSIQSAYYTMSSSLWSDGFVFTTQQTYISNFYMLQQQITVLHHTEHCPVT